MLSLGISRELGRVYSQASFKEKKAVTWEGDLNCITQSAVHWKLRQPGFCVIYSWYSHNKHLHWLYMRAESERVWFIFGFSYEFHGTSHWVHLCCLSATYKLLLKTLLSVALVRQKKQWETRRKQCDHPFPQKIAELGLSPSYLLIARGFSDPISQAVSQIPSLNAFP